MKKGVLQPLFYPPAAADDDVEVEEEEEEDERDGPPASTRIKTAAVKWLLNTKLLSRNGTLDLKKKDWDFSFCRFKKLFLKDRVIPRRLKTSSRKVVSQRNAV